MLYLYTDGSSTGRSKREGGWAWVLVKDGVMQAECFGGEAEATNNTMELRAAIEGLAYILENGIKEQVTLISDSMYVLGIATGEYTPHKNIELAKVLRDLFIHLKAESRWVKGHSGDEFNEVADQLSKKGKALYAKRV